MKTFKHQRKMTASASEVFRAYEDPEVLTKWYGPEGFTTTTNSFEFEPGGKWEFVMHGPDGTSYPNEIIFQEIIKPNKIVMRHSVEPYFTATIGIEDVEDGVMVTFIQEFDSEDVAKNIAHVVQPANEQVLDKLQTIAENSK